MATTIPKTTQFLRQRKMLTVMPLILLPFITILFWSFDGGQVATKAAVVQQKGINTDLPTANLKTDVPTDKMSIYQQTAKDSTRLRESDPNYGSVAQSAGSTSLQRIGTAAGTKYGQNDLVADAGLNSSPVYQKGRKDPNEEKVNAKLKQLYQTLDQNQQAQANTGSNPYAGAETNRAATEANANADQVSKMIAQMSSKNGEPDPEMQQMNGMLEKILDIQNPNRVRERLQEKSIQNRGAVYAVNTSTNDGRVGLIRQTRNIDNIIYQDTPKTRSYRNIQAPASMGGPGRKIYAVNAPQNVKRNGFYGLADNNSDHVNNEPNAVQAVIHQAQTLVAGSIVKMRLLTDIFLNGQRIPKDNFIYGVASIQEERLNIVVSSIRYKNSLYPVSLMVYDMDGLNGIYIPGAIERDASKDAVASGINGVDYMSVNPSVTTQLATSAVSGAKGLFSKKVKLIKVNVKANYKVLLQDTKQNL